jgi:class 3 adenylate cyclase
MPLFMDIHRGVKATEEDLCAGHLRDLEAQGEYGVRYLSYWFNPGAESVCCLVEAPNAEAASKVHIEANGAAADKIISVEPEVVEAFLGGSLDAGLGRMVGRSGDSDGGFRTVLFTDVADSTGMTQRLGDVAARAIVREHDEIVRRETEARGGRVVKHTGDGIMAAFAACSTAVQTAIVIQQRFGERNARPDTHPLRVRIGLSAGEPVEEGDDLFGTAVQLARRVCDAAPPECIYVANVIRELCAGKGFEFTEVGTQSFKGFTDAVTVYNIGWTT